MHTTKSCGISFVENQVGWHHHVPDDEEYQAALKENAPVKVVSLGLPDEPAIASKSAQIFHYYGMDAEGIVKKKWLRNKPKLTPKPKLFCSLTPTLKA